MKKLLLLLPIVASVALTTLFSSASAVSLNVKTTNQIYAQKSSACSSATVSVGVSVTNGVVVTNIPTICIGQTMIVRLTGGALGLTAIVVEGAITGTTTTFPNATLSTLLGTVGSLGAVQSQVMINGWYMRNTWVGGSV